MPEKRSWQNQQKVSVSLKLYAIRKPDESARYLMDKQVKPKGEGIVSDQVPRRVMLTAREVRASRSARNHPALMLFPAKSGNAVVKSQCDE